MTRAIMHVDSYSSKAGSLLLSASDYSIRAAIKDRVEISEAKNGGYLRLDISPYKQRSTGKYSQNNLIWKLISTIAGYTGFTIYDVEEYAKKKAVARGYPYKINPLTGEMRVASTTELDTVEAGYLIDTLYQIIAEMEIPFSEVY